VIGAVIGIGLTYGFAGVRQIRWKVLANIGSGWMFTPIVAAAISFFFLFFLQNVFQQQVFSEVRYRLSDAALVRAAESGVDVNRIEHLREQEVVSAAAFRKHIRAAASLDTETELDLIAAAELHPMILTDEKIAEIDVDYLGEERASAVRALQGRRYEHRWQLREALEAESDAWRARPDSPATRGYNSELDERRQYLFRKLPESND
jgi:phosphate/sulfate permease